MNNNFTKMYLLTFFIIMTLNVNSQAINLNEFDEDFVSSLPESVQDDIFSEIKNGVEDDEANFKKRPSSKLSKLETVKKWENFIKKESLAGASERYGLRMFSTMQSSFMPLNEPNFGNNYIVDYGDKLSIQLVGGSSKQSSNKIEVMRDGSITLNEIGKVQVAGLNFEQATKLIQQQYENSFIGVEVMVSLAEIRDINVLITGNVEFPGIYTLSGNSNILQALNISGGISEIGSLRNITIKRDGMEPIVVDLYKALLFGDIKNIPFLMSGDSIYVEAAKNLVRAGYGFNNTAIFELKDNETISDLIRYSGGLNTESNNGMLKLIRFESNSFNSYEINQSQFNDFQLDNLDSIYAYKEKVGTVTITGDIKHPGKYSFSSTDRLLDIIQRSGGYNDSAYSFGASLYRDSSIKLEEMFAKKTYQDLITFIVSNPSSSSSGSGGEGLAFLLSELKNFEPLGRVIAEFDENILSDNLQDNIFLADGDRIHIPSYPSNVFIFGEVGNPGSVLFKDDINIIDYIKKSGGFTKFSSKDSIFIVSPNGETSKVQIQGLRKYIDQDYEIYPGSVIYVPRHIAKIQGVSFYATVAPIFSSLALSIASLNSLK